MVCLSVASRLALDAAWYEFDSHFVVFQGSKSSTVGSLAQSVV
jgi:hypothetical protein